MKLNKHNLAPDSSPVLSRIKRGAASLALGGTLAGGLAACGTPDTPKTAKAPETVTAPATTQSPEAPAVNPMAATELAASQNLKEHAIAASNRVLSIMANKASGTESYRQSAIGNKPAICGPDGQSGTPDDIQFQKFPELFASYDAATHTMSITATGERNFNAEHPIFDSANSVFTVNPTSAIATKTEQLTIDDFITALPDATLVALSGSSNENHTVGNDSSSAGLYHGEYGFVSDQFAEFTATENKLDDPTKAITNPNMLIQDVNMLTGIVDSGSRQLVITSQS